MSQTATTAPPLAQRQKAKPARAPRAAYPLLSQQGLALSMEALAIIDAACTGDLATAEEKLATVERIAACMKLEIAARKADGNGGRK